MWRRPPSHGSLEGVLSIPGLRDPPTGPTEAPVTPTSPARQAAPLSASGGPWETSPPRPGLAQAFDPCPTGSETLVESMAVDPSVGASQEGSPGQRGPPRQRRDPRPPPWLWSARRRHLCLGSPLHRCHTPIRPSSTGASSGPRAVTLLAGATALPGVSAQATSSAEPSLDTTRLSGVLSSPSAPPTATPPRRGATRGVLELRRLWRIAKYVFLLLPCIRIILPAMIHHGLLSVRRQGRDSPLELAPTNRLRISTADPAS